MPSDSVALVAAGIAHDLNNLLTVITGNSHLGAMQSKDAASRRRWLQVREAGELASQFTRQLMDLTRQSMGPRQPVSPNEVITRGLELLARLAGDRVTITSSLSPAAGMILIDSAELLQVLINLVLNARDAMPAGGTLSLETRPHAEPGVGAENGTRCSRPYVLLTVTDTGTGMDETTQSRAFETFFTTKSSTERTGLGLSVVSSIVRRCGGHIGVSSRPGAGTTFRLYFPEAGQG